MKYYVLISLLFVGLVVGASADSINEKLMGSWVSEDGPCSPCTLDIKGDKVSFTMVGDEVDVINAQGTPEPGIHVFLEKGGELDLKIESKGKRLSGFYSTWASEGTGSMQEVVIFDKKK